MAEQPGLVCMEPIVFFNLVAALCADTPDED